TCWLLGNSTGEVYEANPVAAWCLARYGLAGLVGFKAATVLVVLGLAAVIAASGRQRVAGGILRLGCASLLLVIGYSASLCPAALRTPEERKADQNRQVQREIDALNQATRADHCRRNPFRALAEQLRKDLAGGLCSLADAAARL